MFLVALAILLLACRWVQQVRFVVGTGPRINPLMNDKHMNKRREGK